MEEHERSDRQMAELLQELRIALPGVQILFAFLLTVPFAQGFEKVTSFQRTLFFVSLLATAASTICLIAPTADAPPAVPPERPPVRDRVRQPAPDRRASCSSASRSSAR